MSERLNVVLSWEIAQGVQSIPESSLQYANANALLLAKEMTLEAYEKVLEEKRKALQALKTEEKKVDTKDFESMQQLSSKKDNDDVFIKLGSDKDERREAFEKEEKSKHVVMKKSSEQFKDKKRVSSGFMDKS